MKPYLLTLAAAAAACVGGWAVAADTPYQPKSAATGGVGYGQERLDATHWLIKFVGDRDMDRHTVETYLLYRAAELTVKKGGDWFETSGDDTAVKRVVPDRLKPADATVPGYGWGWRPHWSYFQVEHVVKFRPGAPNSTVPVRGPSAPPTQRYVATAQISIGKGPQPKDRRVFDARELMAQLGPGISKPAQDPAGSPTQLRGAGLARSPARRLRTRSS
jgi:hypothetical protein